MNSNHISQVMSDHQASGVTGPGFGLLPQNKIRTTPRAVRSNGGDQGITKLRQDIADQMEGEFTVTGVEDFISSYLPFEPTDADVNAMVQLGLSDTSKKPAILVEEDEELHFVDFPVAPCRADGTETASYKPLRTIADTIGSGIVEGRARNNFNYRGCPETPLESQISGSDNKIDGCFTTDPDTVKLNTSHIACVFEYKLEPSKEALNNIQAVSANVQIMNDDARRMFTYGITIVQDLVTLWYHSRSHSAISETFSFVENPQLLIKVFMSFLFATEEELGYDPMVTQDSQSIQGDYLYRIPSQDGQSERYFRTDGSISEYRSSNITGRMARIWKIIECDSKYKPLSSSEAPRVLKDVWLEDSALVESEIQSQIFKDIEEFLHQQQEDKRYLAFQQLRPSLDSLAKNQEYMNYFIKIETDYVGKQSKALAPNSKRKRRLFPHSELHVTPMPSTTTLANRNISGSPRPIEAGTKFDDRPRAFARRKQYRVVFREVCEAIGDLETLGEVTDVLSQALVALRLMYCAGWVHRDISSGNILAHRHSPSSAWQAKLSDLEYARRFSPDLDRDVATDPKTGTPYFMPHEILSSYYISNVTMPPAVPSLSALRRSHGKVNQDHTSQDLQQAVVYNFQHDLESIWWIFLWTATSRVPHPPSLDFAKRVFQNNMTPSMDRLQCILAPISSSLKQCLQPSLVDLAGIFEDLRYVMLLHYINRLREQKLFDLTSYIDIHNDFATFFEEINNTQATWRGTALATYHRHVVTTVANVSKPSRRKRPTPRDDAAFVPESSESESEPAEDEYEELGRRKKPRLAKASSR